MTVTTRTTRFRRRRGATLVEVMIAAAMLMLGMWLLVWLYQQGMNAFLVAKAQSDLSAQERMVTAVMSADLSRDMFLPDEAKPNRGRTLADHDLRGGANVYIPPKAGYLRAYSAPPPAGYYEPSDSDGFGSSRSVDHYIQFTALVPGGPDHLMFGAEVPARSGSQWYGTAAEITYALVPSFRRTPNQTPLYDLVRRQRLTARTRDDQPAYQSIVNNNPGDPVYEVMAVAGSTALRLDELTRPANRLNPRAPQITNIGRAGQEKLLANVLSMEIKFTGPRVGLTAQSWPSDLASTEWPRSLAWGNSDFPFDFLPFNGEFDTYTRDLPYDSTQYATPANPGLPLKRLRITAALIKLRVYNPQNNATRQTSFVVKF
jgi:hypothetical protein